MMSTTIAWVLAFVLFVLIAFHLRMRSTLKRLSAAIEEQGKRWPGFDEADGLTPGYVRKLVKVIDDRLLEASQRISEKSEWQRLNASILDQFDEGLLIVNRDLRIESANEAARRDFGQGKPIVGKTVIEAFFDHRFVNLMERAMQFHTKQSDTIRMDEVISQHGETMERYISVEAGPLPSQHPSVSGLWVILRDESERYHVDQVRKDFVANASHEIRTPLSIITGYLENLTTGEITDAETVQRFYGVMSKHAERLARIVDDMLTITKLERSPESLNVEVFDMAECVFDIVEHLQTLIMERDAEVIVDFPEEDRSMVGDRFYWDQVFFNLIENALKQNDRPGLEVVVELRSTETEHRIVVKDDGVGIPSSHMPHVFKRFYRVERHHSKNQVKGTGLGLSIVKRAVEAHGGTVSLTSQPGIETVITIVVPKGTAV